MSATCKHLLSWLSAACCLAAPLPASSADTIETWDAGSGDIDFYLTMDGMGEDAASQGVAGDMLLGWGVADRLSAYLAVSLMADGYLDGGGTEMGVGLFGTPIDTDHVDLDLQLDICAGGSGLTDLCLGPAVELNLDAAPDLSAWGAYIRAGLAVSGRGAPGDAPMAKAAAQGEAAVGPTRLVDGLVTFGGYLSLDRWRQILIEYDLAWLDEPEPGEPALEHSGVAFGYNQVVSDRLEFISQARFEVPQNGQAGSLGFTIGLIASLPGAREATAAVSP